MSAISFTFDTLRHELGGVLPVAILRLALAALLGGVIGLEREFRRKPAGLRTNMLMCFGCAMFTLLSHQLAAGFGGDHTRIAAQIIPGIGFIGAGSILHARGSVTGLTTAATIFVVASIGMASGGGLYATAIFATVVLLIALALLGSLEGRYALKATVHTYEVKGKSTDSVLDELNRILETERLAMRDVHAASFEDSSRVIFGVEASRPEHDALVLQLYQSSQFSSVKPLGNIVAE
ncbi:MAG TPA: MgtC/SapB family protein [Terriglobales bacterium]|nr:MgtC/SapB family protein [Terriglobales bacterium]